MYPVLLQVGHFELRAYGVIVVLAFLAGLWLTRKRLRADGLAFFMYLAAYGVARFSTEFFRGDPATIVGDVPAAQVFAALLFFASIAGYVLQRRRITP